MKELSIEEKAKRYDEAIELAKDSFNYPDYPGFIRADVVFPEIKKSEDERIRKELIDFVNSRLAGFPQCKKFIAWIEKQKESNTNTHLPSFDKAQGTPIINQCEQNPADKVEPKFRIGDVIEVKPMKCHSKIFTGKPNKIVDITEKGYILDDGKAYSIELQDGWELIRQKPAWSKEDEEMLSRCISATFDHGYLKECDWLKSLKERIINRN